MCINLILTSKVNLQSFLSNLLSRTKDGNENMSFHCLLFEKKTTKTEMKVIKNLQESFLSHISPFCGREAHPVNQKWGGLSKIFERGCHLSYWKRASCFIQKQIIYVFGCFWKIIYFGISLYLLFKSCFTFNFCPYPKVFNLLQFVATIWKTSSQSSEMRWLSPNLNL